MQAKFDRFFQDDQGNIIVAQPPNLPLIVWAIASILKLIFTSGNPYLIFDATSLTAIVVWSLLEIFQGVNYFRRTLGLIVLVATLVSRL